MRASAADQLANGFAARSNSDGGDDTLWHQVMKKAEPHAAAPPGEWIMITGALP
jgi:hypothetical protein